MRRLPWFGDDPQVRALVAMAWVHGLYALEARGLPLRLVWLVALPCATLSRRVLESPMLWGGLCLSYAAAIVSGPLALPNHHYLLAYSALAACLSRWSRLDAPACLAENCRWLLFSVMGVATFQKLLSPAFMDGQYFGFMLAKGSFLPLLFDRFEDVAHNKALVARFLEVPPAPGQADPMQIVRLASFPGLALYAKVFSWATVLAELGLCVAMAARPWSRLTQASWLVFLLVLAPLRQELVFLCVLCALGVGVHAQGGDQAQRRWGVLLLVMLPLAVYRLAHLHGGALLTW